MTTSTTAPQCCGTHPATAHPVLLTVRQCAERHPFIGERGLRNLIFNAETNGFSAVLIRVGRKVLIHEENYFAWIQQSQNR